MRHQAHWRVFMMSPAVCKTKLNPKLSPIYWFYLLEEAKNRCDFEAALAAKKQLEQLGVFVVYRRRSKAPNSDVPPI